MNRFSLSPVFILLATVTAADDKAMTPASFGDQAAETWFGNVIEWPETHGDANVNFPCVIELTARGKIAEGGCYSQNNWDRMFIQSVYRGAKKALLTPAKIGKKGYRARVHFIAEFVKEGEDKTISFYLFAPIQENLDEYGPTHVSAQRLLGKERWRKACPQQAEWDVIAKAHVDSTGQASSVDLEHVKGIVPTGTCLSAITEAINTSRFIPAFADGVPVPSSYSERFPFLN